MFIAKFQQTNTDKLKADRHNVKPFIGEVLYGKATGTLYNGTMFQREGLEPNRLYLCENFVTEERPDLIQVRIMSSVPLLELKALADQLGEAVLDIKNASTPV